MNKGLALRFVETIRGEMVDGPESAWPKAKSARFGSDMVGGWLLRNGGLVEGLEREKNLAIPPGGTSGTRRADWLLGKRIVIEVKTYGGILGQGGDATNTHQIMDFALWRDEVPDKRAVVLARVAWKGNPRADDLFKRALEHFKVPLLTFAW